MTESTVMPGSPENAPVAPRKGTALPPSTSPLPPVFVLICLVFFGCAWIHFSQLFEALWSEGVKPAAFQWRNDWLSLAKFIGSQAFFFLLILSGLRPTFYRSSVFAGCGISISLSYFAWLAFFKSSEHVAWWSLFRYQEKAAAVCLLGLGAFFFIRWLALPSPTKGESPFLGGFLVAGIPCIIIGPLFLLLFSHHHWLAFIRDLPLISNSLLAPMVGNAMVYFSSLNFFLFLIPILSGFLAQLRWRIPAPGESVEPPADWGFIKPQTLFYVSCLLTIFTSKVVMLAALSSSIESLQSISLTLGLILPLPLSMIIFAFITPLFLLEWLLLFSWNNYLKASATDTPISPSENAAVPSIAGACLVQTIMIFALGLDSGLEIFYLVSLTVVVLMSGDVEFRRHHQNPISDIPWHTVMRAYWETNLLSGFIVFWVNSTLIYLALAIGLDFVPLIPSLANWNVTELAEKMARSLVPAFPLFAVGAALLYITVWVGSLSLLMSGIFRFFSKRSNRALPRENPAN
ncbi:MAG: hypothetical protein WA705_02575 [Candidatus Ozemobacteraceae bacterium]